MTMNDMHIITESNQESKFYVRVAVGDDFRYEDFTGDAYLHASGALLVRPQDGASVYYGPGRWVSVHLEERVTPPLPPLPKAV